MPKIVVLTGAGMSADSGLPTFRDSGGLWEGHDISEVATVEGWNNAPENVLEFYNRRREDAHKAEPNEGHFALVELEEDFDVSIVTQNVDSLHERAGSTEVLHLHGELSKVRSTKDPSLVYDIGGDQIALGDKAEDGSQLRPHVVWFGEMVPNMEKAVPIVSEADIIIVIGTSLAVYPAASLIEYAGDARKKFIIDPQQPENVPGSEWEHIAKSASEGTPELVKQLMG